MTSPNLVAPGRGRPKGARNKVTRAAKEVIAQTAEQLGGVDRLVAWAKEDPRNERAFWTAVYPKLIPIQVGGDPDNPVITEIRRSIVRPAD